jgi:hypothetical protein
MVPDHVWDSFDQMARDMGADRDSLVSQALFMFARLNGYLSPAAGGASIRSNPAPGGSGLPARGDAVSVHVRSRVGGDSDAPRRSGAPPKLSEPPATEAPPRREVADRVLETAAELERLMKDKPPSDPGPLDSIVGEAGAELFLVGDAGALEQVAKDRFVIGRGKHCDLVINSGKVSREHAAILREGSEHFIEDLGSSNGTWFDKQRIHRRKIEDGDEYFICNEKVKCVIK